MEVVSHSITISLWGRRPVEWIHLPSVGRSGGIIILWEPLILKLVDSRIGSFSVCCKFKSLEDNFEWGLIGVYGPNDDHLRCALFEELVSFMSSWDILWCLGGDFNVIRFPSERSSGGHLTWAMRGFSAFIDSCNLIDPPLEGARFTWSSHEVVPVLSRIDWFLYSVEWEDHFHGVHQVIVPKITSDHFPILLRVGEVFSGRRPFKFENMWLDGWLL